MRGFVKIPIVLAIAALAVYVLFFWGTGEGEDAVVFSFWGSYQEWELWDEIIKAYEAKHPDALPVKVEYWADGSMYGTKANIRFRTGEPPDVMLFQDEPFAPVVEEGHFRDLTDRLDKTGAVVDLGEFYPVAAKSFRWKGRQYGVPVWGGCNLVYANLDLFEEFGVEPPTDDWTLEEFVAKGKALTRSVDDDDRPDVFGLAPQTYWLYCMPFVWAHGAKLLETGATFPTPAKNTRWVFVGPEAVRSLEFLQGLLYDEHISPQGAEAGGESDMGILFLTGRIGMYTSGPWEMPVLNRVSREDLRWDVFHMPAGPAGRHTRVTWDCLAIPTDAAHPDEAWRFIRFATSAEAQAMVARRQRSIPALKAAAEVFIETNPDVHAERFIEAMEYARMQPMTELWSKMVPHLTYEFQQLYMKDPDERKSPRAVVRDLADKMGNLFRVKGEAP